MLGAINSAARVGFAVLFSVVRLVLWPYFTVTGIWVDMAQVR